MHENDGVYVYDAIKEPENKMRIKTIFAYQI